MCESNLKRQKFGQETAYHDYNYTSCISDASFCLVHTSGRERGGERRAEAGRRRRVGCAASVATSGAGSSAGPFSMAMGAMNYPPSPSPPPQPPRRARPALHVRRTRRRRRGDRAGHLVRQRPEPALVQAAAAQGGCLRQFARQIRRALRLDAEKHGQGVRGRVRNLRGGAGRGKMRKPRQRRADPGRPAAASTRLLDRPHWSVNR